MHTGQEQAGFLQFEFSCNGKQTEDVLNIRTLRLLPSLHTFSESMYLFKHFFKQECAYCHFSCPLLSQAHRTYVRIIEHFPLQVTHTVYFLDFVEFSAFFGIY